MDALVNYGSDDESSDKYLENKGVKSEELKTSGRLLNDTIEDVNYDNVQMDMSEESDAGQRHKGGGDARRSSSTSSCRSSSSENEDGPPNARNRHSSSIIHDVKKTKECRVGEQEGGGGYGDERHRRKEESRKEESRHRRKGRRSRSKERSGKSRDSKEKEKDRRRYGSSRDDPHNFESSSKDVSRSSNREGGSSRRSRSRDTLGYRHHSDRRRSRSRSPHHRHHRRSHHHHRHRDESERSSRNCRRSSRGRSPSKNHSGDESRSVEAKKASDVSRAVAEAAANIAAAVAATEAVQSSTPLKNEGSGQANDVGAENGDQQSGNMKNTQQAALEGLGLQVEGSVSKGSLASLSGNMVTPQQLVVPRSLEMQASHVHSATGIQFPAYYNPAAMNPLKYAEQMQKRRKLWGGNKDASKESASTTSGSSSGSTNNWESTTFAQDQDGKLSAKFKRLMGIKSVRSDGGGVGGGGNTSSTPSQPEGSSQPSDVIKKQEELFSTMERQYEAARLATHTLRGVGLGFGSSSTYQYPR